MVKYILKASKQLKQSRQKASISYFTVVFSNLKKELSKRGYKVSAVQTRLVFKKLCEDNSQCVNYSEQKEAFIKAVIKYVNVSREFVESLL